MTECIHLKILERKCRCKSVQHCEYFNKKVIPSKDCKSCEIPQLEERIEEPMIDYMKVLNDVLIQSNPPEYYDVAEGSKGIITVGGGKYWYGIVAGIKLLRWLGCNLPVEIWYRGECERVYPDEVQDLNVLLFDVDKMGKELGDSRIPTGNVKSGGWEAKLYALTHTHLEKVLFIDADAYCVNDPSPLFDLLNEAGFVYWKDLPGQMNAIKWKDVYSKGVNTNVMPVQGGQILIDRKKNWKLVCMAHTMCQHSEFFFKKMYGDQDTWRVALAMLEDNKKDGYNGCKMLGKADWESVAFNCKYNNIPYIVHRCRGKLFAPWDIPPGKVRYSNPHYHLPREVEIFDYLAESINRHSQDSTKAFSSIYKNALWGNSSGMGSTLREARPYIDFINNLIRSKGYQSVVDVGCGDGLIASYIKCAKYVGYDCAEIVIKTNKKKYKNLTFLPLDILEKCDIIQHGDILLCKDVLHHWPNELVKKWLKSLIESKKWKTIVLCQDRKQLHSKQDCYLGGYRALNHEMEPLKEFNLVCAMEYLHKAILIHEH